MAETNDVQTKIAVMDADIRRLFSDVSKERDFRILAVGEIKIQLTDLQKHLYAQDREFRGVINRILGALIVLQIIVPVALQYIFKS